MFSCLWILTKMIWQCLKIICFIGSYSFYALLDSDQPIAVCDVADRDVAPWWTNSQHWTGKGASYPPVSAAGQVDQKSRAWLGSQQRGVCFGLTTPPLTPSAGLRHPDSPHPARCCSGCFRRDLRWLCYSGHQCWLYPLSPKTEAGHLWIFSLNSHLVNVVLSTHHNTER